MSGELPLLTLERLIELLRRREVRPLEVVDAVLERIAHVGPILECFVEVLEDDSRRRSLELEQEPTGTRSPLWGVPITVKDNIDVAGVPTTAGSKVLPSRPATRDASAVARLRGAGAIVVAKTSLYEFAFGAQNPAFGRPRNPWDLTLSTGGSSSGSVAAVAAGAGYASLATDTGGSIRVPAGFCGVCGLKPTFARVPTDGVVPVSWTLDHVGPIARTSRDIARVFEALVPGGAFDLEELERGVAGLAIGVAIPDADVVDAEVKGALETSFGVLESAGASLVQLTDLPAMSTARTCLWAIASAEAADYHRTMLDASADRYHPLVRRRLARGRLIPAVDYVRAQRVRRQLAVELEAVSQGCDVLVLPLVPVPPYPLGAERIPVPGGVEETSTVVTHYTPLFSLTGWPALAVPFGRTSSGLPIGIQIAAKPAGEGLTLRVARTLENEAPQTAAAWPSGITPNLPGANATELD